MRPFARHLIFFGATLGGAAFALACGANPSAGSIAGDASADSPIGIGNDAAGEASASDASEALSDSGAPNDAPIDAGRDASIATVDAAALVLPQVLDFDGGVLTTPHLVAVTFPGDSETTQINVFMNAIGASAYWTTVTSEYGVGAALGGTVAESEPAPTSVDQSAGDSEAWLATRFDGTHPEWGTFDPSAVYLVFYPSTTTTPQSVGGCGGAYHNSIPITVAGVDGGAATKATMIYGIVFRCATSPDVGRPTGFALTTFMASHEMVEAATDPYGTAFSRTENASVAWAYFFGTEVGDMCAFHAGDSVTPADVGFTVQRTWSNAAALAFHDPCVPGASDPFFVAAPVAEGPVTLAAVGTSFATQGFSLPLGHTITVDVGFYGSAAGAWSVTPFTYTMEHGQPEPYLKFSPATLTGKSGDVVPLLIERVAEDQDGNGGDAVKLASSLGGATNEWYFALTN